MSENRPLDSILEERISRRDILKLGSAASASVILGGALSAEASENQTQEKTAIEGKSLSFKEIDTEIDKTIHVPEGYKTQVFLRWGDPIHVGVPEFSPLAQTSVAQEGQFGFNNDYVGFFPLPYGSESSSRGLLCVNHEYTIHDMLLSKTQNNSKAGLSKDLVDIELSAHGHSVVEVRREGSQWHLVKESRYNRRISALSAQCLISGPAAGDDRLKTSADPSGRLVIGTLNNCAGGTTPWGTVLTAEENIHIYFGGRPQGTKEEQNHRRFGVGGANDDHKDWARHYDRFNIEKEPHEPNRFGWIVEIDPYNPNAKPVKRTAMGRVKHEGAVTTLNYDNRVVVYTGDDQIHEYIYKFVSQDKYNPDDRLANIGLLDHGTLYVARFDSVGGLQWRPLIYGEGPLTKKNGFSSQADVLIETRRAADLLGATPMDRPEDIEVSPLTGKVYSILTKNSSRKFIHPSNPRPNNRHGHVLEFTPPTKDGKPDHSATEFAWEIFLLAGNPYVPRHRAQYGEGVSEQGWLSCPDNGVFDNKGRLWLTTDGAPAAVGKADGLYACETDGPHRAVTKRFFAAPRGAEVCGPCFTPDGTTLFVAVQHPGSGSTFDRPSTRWPDFQEGMPPRPSIVAITREGGKAIGG